MATEHPVNPKLPINCCEEPFRIFFPIGALLALLGVLLWPLYYAGALAEYPSIPHARLMIEGFMASFIIGFLGTAGPRITSAPHFTRMEVVVLVTLDLFAAGLHVGGSHRAADFLFAFALATFAFILGKRFAQRADSPPPNFVLVALGLLNGVIGALLLALYQDELYAAPYRIGASLLEQGFVLLPILGVGPYLLARLLNISRADDLPESRVLPPGWLPARRLRPDDWPNDRRDFRGGDIRLGRAGRVGCAPGRFWFTSRSARLGAAAVSWAIVCASVWPLSFSRSWSRRFGRSIASGRFTSCSSADSASSS